MRAQIAGPPSGLIYRAGFLSKEEEGELLSKFSELPFSPFKMRGVTSKREVIHYGWNYLYDLWKIEPANPPPDCLALIRQRAAEFAGVPAEELEEVLLSKYPAGAGIGWHRDAPMFGSPVIGISIGCECVMRFRKKSEAGFIFTETALEPRSIYLLEGESRTHWQHSIPSVKDLRYSITFRRVHAKFKSLEKEVFQDQPHVCWKP